MTTEEKKTTSIFRNISKYAGILSGSVAVAGGGVGRACQTGVKAAGKLFVPCKDGDSEASQAAEPFEAAEAADTDTVETPEPASAEESAKDAAQEPEPELSPEEETEATDTPDEGGEKKTPPSL